MLHDSLASALHIDPGHVEAWPALRWLKKTWAWLLGRAPDRRHRFCDRQGNPIHLATFLRNAPEAIVTSLAALLGSCSTRPWISCSARRELLRRLPRTSTVLEFGSGGSTVWLARHFDRVYSVEDSPLWFARVSRQLRAEQLDNVVYHQSTSPIDYASFPSEEVAFDLILIDGRHRGRCLDQILARLERGALVYVDDTDHPDMGPLLERLTSYVEVHGGELRRFIDFPANDFRVRQGMLAILPCPGQGQA